MTGANTQASRSSLSTADRGDRDVQRLASGESCRGLTGLTVTQRDSPLKATSTPRRGRPNRACLGRSRKVTQPVPLKRHLVNCSCDYENAERSDGKKERWFARLSGVRVHATDARPGPPPEPVTDPCQHAQTALILFTETRGEGNGCHQRAGSTLQGLVFRHRRIK